MSHESSQPMRHPRRRSTRPMSVEQSRAEHAARQRWERALRVVRTDTPSRARRASGPARPSGVALTWPPDDPSAPPAPPS